MIPQLILVQAQFQSVSLDSLCSRLYPCQIFHKRAGSGTLHSTTINQQKLCHKESRSLYVWPWGTIRGNDQCTSKCCCNVQMNQRHSRDSELGLTVCYHRCTAFTSGRSVATRLPAVVICYQPTLTWQNLFRGMSNYSISKMSKVSPKKKYYFLFIFVGKS